MTTHLTTTNRRSAVVHGSTFTPQTRFRPISTDAIGFSSRMEGTAADRINNLGNLQAMTREIQNLHNEIRNLRNENNNLRNENNNLRNERENLILNEGRESDRLRKERNELREKLARREVQITAIAGILATAVPSNPTPSPNHKRSRSSTSSITVIDRLQTSQNEGTVHTQLPDGRSIPQQKLCNAQDIIEKVNELNAEISHLSVFLAESQNTWLKFGTSSDNGRVLQAEDNINAFLGKHLKDLLTSPHTISHAENSKEIVAYALQAAFCAVINRIIFTNFFAGLPRKYDDLISTIYFHVCRREPQATSALWRFLTHQYIDISWPQLAEDALVNFVDYTSALFADILTLNRTDTSKGHLSGLYGDELKKIGLLARTIAEAVRWMQGEKNFELVSVKSGTAFQRRLMKNLFDGRYLGGKAEDGERVSCTTQFGLKSVSGIDEKIHLKPVVILETITWKPLH